MNPISDGLHDLVSSDEAAFRAAHSGRGVDLEPRARRARRVRATTRAGLVVTSVAVLTVSAFSISTAVRHDPTETDPVAPPIPEGYERVVIPLDANNFDTYRLPDIKDPIFDAAGFYNTTCNVPLQIPDDLAGPFGLEIAKVNPTYTADPTAEGEWIQSGLSPMATLTYDGRSDGAANVSSAFWLLLRSDQTIATDTSEGMFSQIEAFSLNEPSSASLDGWVSLWDCAKSEPWSDPAVVPTESLVDPGQYSVVAVVKVGWSIEGEILLNADRLGYDASWFGAGWKDAIPCGDAIAEAEDAQNGNAIECTPHLYFQQIPTVGDFALVDVPTDFFTGPRRDWYVVSDPYPIELPIDDEPPTF